MKMDNYDGKRPIIDESVWLHPSCVIIGDVKIDVNSVIYPGCIIRGDIAPVRIGANVVIQDGVLINAAMGNPTRIGDETLIAFGAIIHGAKIGKKCIIGIRTTIMPGVKIGNDVMIGAYSFILKGRIPNGKVWMGIPAVEKRDMKDSDRNTWEYGKKVFREITKKYT